MNTEWIKYKGVDIKLKKITDFNNAESSHYYFSILDGDKLVYKNRLGEIDRKDALRNAKEIITLNKG